MRCVGYRVSRITNETKGARRDVRRRNGPNVEKTIARIERRSPVSADQRIPSRDTAHDGLL